MKDAEEKAREILRAWQDNPGIAGEPDLQERIARSLREAHAAGKREGIEECATVIEAAFVRHETPRMAGLGVGIANHIRALADRDAGGGE